MSSKTHSPLKRFPINTIQSLPVSLKYDLATQRSTVLDDKTQATLPGGLKQVANSYKFKQLNEALKAPKKLELQPILEHGANSSGLAAVREGWFFRTGCCATIKESSTGKRILYYIPHVGPMSIKKKISYIKEVEKFLPKRIKFLRVESGTKLTHPLSKDIGAKRIIIQPETQGVMRSPASFVPATKYLVVYGRAECNYDRLLYLQFLRPLYQTIPVGYPLIPENIQSYTVVNTEYYQPRLYFRLKSMFPDMKQTMLMYLSFTIHGTDISSTFFPYYSFMLSPRQAAPTETLLGTYENILGLLHINGGQANNNFMLDAKDIPWELAKEQIFPDIPVRVRTQDELYHISYGRIPNPSQYIRRYLLLLFSYNTKDAYVAAIKLIADVTQNKYLADYINPSK